MYDSKEFLGDERRLQACLVQAEEVNALLIYCSHRNYQIASFMLFTFYHWLSNSIYGTV